MLGSSGKKVLYMPLIKFACGLLVPQAREVATAKFVATPGDGHGHGHRMR